MKILKSLHFLEANGINQEINDTDMANVVSFNNVNVRVMLIKTEQI